MKNEKQSSPTRKAVVFLAWGERYLWEVDHCIRQSKEFLEEFDIVLITDRHSDVQPIEQHFSQIIRSDFKAEGLLRKTELLDALERQDYQVYLFLDSDTVVLGDISLGFEKAHQFGLALAPAPHYSLDAFWGFGDVMVEQGTPPKGQCQYNSGVIFFSPKPEVKMVFREWQQLAAKYGHILNNDQPFFTLAMEQVGFNPYTLSISFNYRGFGDAISGDVRIWHSHGMPPENINDYDVAWPPRRAWPGYVEHPKPSYRSAKTKLRAALSRAKNSVLRRIRS